ncbi:hypothetical protein HDU98_010448 [Podochytrium sp. JEL0797]|nr:hypothetical protein HDU98_010448 [Podochytrium sp. JEL0797]
MSLDTDTPLLPFEILAQIIAWLPYSRLHPLLLVSHAWKQAVQQRLWERIAVRRPQSLHLLLASGMRSHFTAFRFVGEVDLGLLRVPHGADVQMRTQFAILLLHCPALTILNLSNCLWLTDKDLLHIANAPLLHLKNLNLHNCTSLAGSTLNSLLESLPQLTHLNLSSCTNITSMQFAFRCNRAPLQSIDLRAIFSLVDINKTLEHIFYTCKSTLRDLYIPGHFLSSSAFNLLINLRPFLTIQILHIETPANLTDTALMYLSRHVNHLRTLSLSQSVHLTSPSVAAFLSHTKQLTALDLSHIPSIDDHVLMSLGAAAAHCLKSICLRGCLKVSDVGLEAVVHAFPGMEEIWLDYTGVSARGVKKVLEGGGFCLRVVTLNSCQGVLGTDVHHLARVLWEEEVGIGMEGKGVGGGTRRVMTMPNSGVTLSQRWPGVGGAEHVGRAHSVGSQGREFGFGRSESDSVRASSVGGGSIRVGSIRSSGASVMRSSGDISSLLGSVLKTRGSGGSGLGAEEAGVGRVASVMGSIRSGMAGMGGRSGSVGGGVGNGRVSTMGIPVGMVAPGDGLNRGDGIKLDPTVIEFLSRRSVERIRVL